MIVLYWESLTQKSPDLSGYFHHSLGCIHDRFGKVHTIFQCSCRICQVFCGSGLLPPSTEQPVINRPVINRSLYFGRKGGGRCSQLIRKEKNLGKETIVLLSSQADERPSSMEELFVILLIVFCFAWKLHEVKARFPFFLATSVKASLWMRTSLHAVPWEGKRPGSWTRPNIQTTIPELDSQTARQVGVLEMKNELSKISG